MIKKILLVVITIFLLPVPFIGAIDILKKFSPYFEGNPLGMYIIISIACGLVSAIAVYYISNKTLHKTLLQAGILLFLTGVFITSVAGLGAAPDFSPTMLQHPEREHYRYILLFMNALFFAFAFSLIISNQWNLMPRWCKWIIVFFIPAFAEMAWEFQHHYFLNTYMQQWINEGKNIAGFMPDYTPEISVRAGGIGRAFQYSVIAWLAFILFKANLMNRWLLIVIAICCAAGCFTGIVVAVLGYGSFGKLQALMLFFIPSGPFVLIYWLGLSLLTKKQTVNEGYEK